VGVNILIRCIQLPITIYMQRKSKVSAVGNAAAQPCMPAAPPVHHSSSSWGRIRSTSGGVCGVRGGWREVSRASTCWPLVLS
jgi:hypothetical protein